MSSPFPVALVAGYFPFPTITVVRRLAIHSSLRGIGVVQSQLRCQHWVYFPGAFYQRWIGILCIMITEVKTADDDLQQKLN
jgi:hypothetical protein